MATRKSPARGPKSDKLWRDAIMVAVKRLTTGGKKTKKLAMLADKLIERALEGDITAMKEIGDRLDGKPAQAVELGGKGGEDLSFTITFVKPDNG